MCDINAYRLCRNRTNANSFGDCCTTTIRITFNAGFIVQQRLTISALFVHRDFLDLCSAQLFIIQY